jgi:oligopeptide transport system substrate-binding protein
VTIGLTSPGSLDPATATTKEAQLLLRTACDGLVGLDPETGKPKPAIASQWSIGKDSASITLQLRPKVRYNDGNLVDAASIRESLSRIARPATASPWATLLRKVKGFAEVQSSQSADLSGIVVDGLGSLTIELSEPDSDMVSILGHPGLVPLSPKAMQKDPSLASTAPPCSGPYRFISEEGEQKQLQLERVSLTRSRNLAFPSDGRGVAKTILVKVFENKEQAFDSQKNGSIDISEVPDSRIAESQSLKGYGRAGTFDLTYLAFDTTKPETADPRVRTAISLAIDRLVLIDATFGDQRQAATSWLPSTADHGPTCADALHKISDPERAKSLLASAAVDVSKLHVPLIFDPAKTNRLVVQAIQVQVKDALGLDMPLQPMETAAFAASLSNHGSPGAWLLINEPHLPVADEGLGTLMRSGSSGNTMALKDTEMDGLIDSARASTSESQADGLWTQAEERACALMPGIPLWFGVRHWVFDDNTTILGDTRLDLFGAPLLRAVGLR